MQTHVWNDFTDQVGPLGAAIEDARREWPHSQLAVMNGWSSPKVLFDDERTHLLRDWLAALLPDDAAWELSGWANIMEQGNGILVHDHARSHLGGDNEWAGVFWLTAPKGSSPLLFHDDGAALEIKPKAGAGIVFAATMPHEAASQRVAGRRVSIAFNARRRAAGNVA